MIKQMQAWRAYMLARAEKFRVDHGYEIDPDGWPARFYLRAYADDRAYWVPVLPGVLEQWHREAAEELPDVATFDGLQERSRKLQLDDGDWWNWTETRRNEFRTEYAAAKEASRHVLEPWLDKRRAAWHEEQAREVRQQFDEARKSLCPFFHQFWIALVFYRCLIPLKRLVGRGVGHVIGAFRWFFGSYSRQAVQVALACVVLAVSATATTHRAKIGNGVSWAMLGSFDWVTGIPERLAESQRQEILAAARKKAEEAEKQRRWAEGAEERAKQARRQVEADRADAEYRRKRQAEFREENRERKAAREARQRRKEAAAAAWAATHPEEVVAKRAIEATKAHAERVDKLLLWLGMAAWVLLALAVWGLFAWILEGGGYNAIVYGICLVLALCFIGLEQCSAGRGTLRALDFLLRLPGIVWGFLWHRMIVPFFVALGEVIMLILVFCFAIVKGMCPVLIPVRKDKAGDNEAPA